MTSDSLPARVSVNGAGPGVLAGASAAAVMALVCVWSGCDRSRVPPGVRCSVGPGVRVKVCGFEICGEKTPSASIFGRREPSCVLLFVRREKTTVLALFLSVLFPEYGRPHAPFRASSSSDVVVRCLHSA